MNKHVFAFLALLALGLIGRAPGAPSDGFTLETQIFVFRNADFRPVKVPGIAGADPGRGVVIRPPVAVQFGADTLLLTGGRYAWTTGTKPPERFSRIDTPVLVLVPGQSMTLLSTVPAQYLEKLGDDTLRLREIAADSPDAPHCRLTFTVVRATDSNVELLLTCDLDVATVTGRETIPGVKLEIGKPALARFAEKLEARVRLAEWSALLLQSPNGSDYSLLLLFKLGPGATVPPNATTTSDGGLMTAEELDRFATYYYLNPRPDQIARAIGSIVPTGFLDDRFEVYAGFFAEVFAQNPGRVGEWQRLMLQRPATAELLTRLRKPVESDGLFDDDVHSVANNDRLWGAFFASSNPGHVRKLAAEMKLIDQYWREWFWTGATAKWSLARNLSEHPVVLATLEAMQAEADPRMRKLIADVLRQDLPIIRQEIVATLAQRRFRDNYGSYALNGPGFTGGVNFLERDRATWSGIGAQAGLPPPNWNSMPPASAYRP